MQVSPALINLYKSTNPLSAMISIVLVEPETSGNVGGTARAMKNFGFNKLVLVNPKCNHLDLDALSRAKHAKSILKKAIVLKKFSDLKKYDTTIATTAALGTDSNVARIPLLPHELADKLPEIRKSNTAIIFGREGTGLRNTEIMKCDFIVTIPTSVRYRSLNISHAAVIIFYELSKKSRMKKIAGHYTPASTKEKAVIMKYLNEILTKLPFATESQRTTQKKIWLRIFGKSMMSRREAFAVIGFLKKASKLK